MLNIIRAQNINKMFKITVVVKQKIVGISNNNNNFYNSNSSFSRDREKVKNQKIKKIFPKVIVKRKIVSRAIQYNRYNLRRV